MSDQDLKDRPVDLFDHAEKKTAEAEAAAAAKPKAERDAENLAKAKAARDDAMVRVAAKANPAWSALMLELVRLTALEQPRFTTDDAFERYDAIPNPPATRELRAMGDVMKMAAKLGYCRKTNTVQASRRETLHASPIAIWESKIYVRD